MLREINITRKFNPGNLPVPVPNARFPVNQVVLAELGRYNSVSSLCLSRISPGFFFSRLKLKRFFPFPFAVVPLLFRFRFKI